MKHRCILLKKIQHQLTMVLMSFGLMLVLGLMQFSPVQAQVETSISDSLDNAKISQFGDFSVQQALTRIPGVQVNRDGEINLRGVGYNSYYVLINGQRLSATSDNTRGTDLSAIPVDVIQHITWQKTLTPDMDADGLAGAIRLTTYQPHTTETVISGSIGGGVNPEYLRTTGATGRSWLRFSGPLSDNLGMTIDVNYQRNQQAREILGMNYSTTDFGSGLVEVVEEFSPGFERNGTDRFGANITLDYNPSEGASYYVHGFANLSQFESAFHQNTWFADDDWVDVDTVDGGNYQYDLNYTEQDISQFTFFAGGENIFDNFKIDYSAGWSQSDIDRTENLFPFEDTNIDYAINTENPERPVVTPVEEKPVPADMRLGEMNYIIDDYRDQEITARINAEVPVRNGSLKFGANTILKEQDANERGAYSFYRYRFLGLVDLEGFETGNVENRTVFNDYDLDRLISSDEALSFFQSSIQNMRLDESAFYKESEIYNYFVDQQVFGGYGMATLDFGAVSVILGARAEYTTAEFEGRVVSYNRFNQFQEALDTTGTGGKTELFPNAQIAFEPSPNFVIKGAYTKSIARPTFNLLAPFELQIPQDTLLFSGNPGLYPVTSNNIDLDVNFSFKSGGYFNVAGFYKTLSNIVERTRATTQIRTGDYEFFEDLIPDGEDQVTGFRETYQNSDNTGSVYGVELSIQKQFNFLPGALQNLGTYLNYSWSESSFESIRGDETSIPGQSPHVVNAALNYSGSKLFAQLAYHWSAELLYELGESPRDAPALSNSPIFLDTYQDGYEELSATMRYDINSQVQLWANLYNIIENENISYEQDQEIYPTNIYQQNGTEFNIGVRLTF